MRGRRKRCKVRTNEAELVEQEEEERGMKRTRRDEEGRNPNNDGTIIAESSTPC